MYKFHTRRQWETRNFMSRISISRAGESCSEARGNISFVGPVGPENTSEGGGGGGYPLRLAKYDPDFIHPYIVHVRLNCIPLFSHKTIQFWTAGPLLYLGARGR